MLAYLRLQNFALIDDLALEFFPGMNVLTGETGAGKSMLIGAINLILGERASSEQVRTGAEQAVIEAVFTVAADYEQLWAILEAGGLPREEELIILREIARSGRNICRVNGRMVPLSLLRELGGALVDLHGQHSHQSLLKPEKHLRLLDEFGDGELLQCRRSLQEVYRRWQKIKQQLKAKGGSPAAREKQLELLVYQKEEILGASLSPEEEEALRERLVLLDNLEKLAATTNQAYMEIYGGENALQPPVVDRINRLEKEISSLLRIDPRLSSCAELLRDAATSLSELGRELYNYLEGLTFASGEKGEIENRLELYRRLKAKYGGSVAEVLAFAQNCAQEIDRLENSAAEYLLAEKEEKAVWQEIERKAAALTAKREAAARRLELLIVAALRELGLENSRFQIQFLPREAPGPEGREEAEFLFSANPGEDPRPLARIISAGEMARVMLALKSILAEQDQIPSMIFDEIDSGIGGYTIQKVSEKMAGLSRKHQVICVTHSPQIASVADHQYYIYKETVKGRTATAVAYLQGEERITEIARLLDGGNMSDITRQHAAELLKKGQER